MDHAADTNRTDLMTITRFVLNEQSKYPESRGDFTILLSNIVIGCKFVCSAVNKAGLAKLIGISLERPMFKYGKQVYQEDRHYLQQWQLRFTIHGRSAITKFSMDRLGEVYPKGRYLESGTLM